jgi:iron complex transport system ATP-binding protein
MASVEPIISLQSVRFGYDVSPVVDGVSAALQAGRVTALIGPNAAGKTTLMRLMLGLLKPWSGSVRIESRPVYALKPATRAAMVSYVPQRPGVRFAFSVRQVVAMGARDRSARDAARRVDEAIERAGLASLADRVLTELSGGQQQRVLLARAEVQSAVNGKAMLLDEPGSHLDLRHRHGMMRRLRELAEGDLAVLVVLHDLDLATRYADTVWLMDRGKLAAAGPWRDVLTPQTLAPVYGMRFEQIERRNDRPILVAEAQQGDTMQA